MTQLFFLKRGRLVLYFLCLLSSSLVAQLDSLYQVAHSPDSNSILARSELFWELMYTDLEAAKLHLDSATQHPVYSTYTKGKANIIRSYGIYHSLKANYDKADSILKVSMQLSRKINDTTGEIACWNELGIIASEQGDYVSATQHYLRVKKLYQGLGNKLGEIKVSLNLGQLFVLRKKFDKAKEYVDQTLDYLHQKQDKKTILMAYSLLSVIYSKKGEIHKAIEIAKKQEQLAIELKDIHQLAIIQHNIGNCYHKIEDNDKALSYSKKAYSLYSQLGLTNAKAMVLHNIAEFELINNENDSSLLHAYESVSLAKELEIMVPLSEGYELLAEIHKKNKNYKEALKYSEKFNHLTDSLRGIEAQNKMNELIIQYEAGEKENQNNLLAKQNKIKSLTIEKQQYSISVLVVIMLLIVLIAFFYLQSRKTKVRIKQVKLEQKALRAQMNPHFIFNSLNNIQHMYSEGKKSIANNYIGDFGELLRIVLDNSGKSSISLQDELNTLKLYLDLEKVRTDGLIDYELNIDDNIDQLNNQVPPLIIQPFVENAIWHGILPTERKGKIIIELTHKEDDLLECTIVDNGVGIEQSKKQKKLGSHESKGMKITEERLQIPNAIKTQELEEGGTKVSLLIPLNR